MSDLERTAIERLKAASEMWRRTITNETLYRYD